MFVQMVLFGSDPVPGQSLHSMKQIGQSPLALVCLIRDITGYGPHNVCSNAHDSVKPYIIVIYII